MASFPPVNNQLKIFFLLIYDLKHINLLLFKAECSICLESTTDIGLSDLKFKDVTNKMFAADSLALKRSETHICI